MSIPIIHQTDLFRPHQDPDDHWDLACTYLLAAEGLIDLRGVLIDWPPDAQQNPDVMAVAQMNHISGLTVPCAVGSSVPMGNRGDAQIDGSPSDRRGVDFLLSVMQDSVEPVAIHVVGSCRDVALAANTDPALFGRKCAAVYLNAGYGSRVFDEGWELEYNVRLDRVSFAAMFDLPSPVYWLPCFEDLRRDTVQEWGTFWRFRQRDVLNGLVPSLKRYFAFMLGREEHSGWLSFLRGGDVRDIFLATYEDYRSMWNTAGFLHSAGRTVNPDGEIVTLEEASAAPLYQFEPIEVRCTDDCITRWGPATGPTTRSIFHVCNLNKYQEAMTRALRSLMARAAELGW
jgi:hypothetical protein